MLWEELFSYEFPQKVAESKGVCLIPVGTLEGTDPDRPVGAYTESVLERCRKAAEKEPCVVFPPLYFGETSGSECVPGTVCYSDELIFDVLEHACSEAHRNGFHKILLVNGSAASEALLQNFCRMLLQKNPDYQVMLKSCPTPKPAENSAFADFYKNGVYIPFARHLEQTPVAGEAPDDWEQLAEVIRFLKNETVSESYHAQWLKKQKAMPTSEVTVMLFCEICAQMGIETYPADT